MQDPKNLEAAKAYPNNIGWWIKKQGYTQEEIADAIGIARRTLSNYIAGRRVTPRHYLEKIAQTIGCDIEELTVQSIGDTNLSPQETSATQQGKGSIPHEESDDMDRRQTLLVLGAAGASLITRIPALASLEEIEKRFARRTARLQSWLLESLEDGTRSRWQLYYTSGQCHLNKKNVAEALLFEGKALLSRSLAMERGIGPLDDARVKTEAAWR